MDQTQRPRPLTTALLALGVALLACLVYAPALRLGFSALDDGLYLPPQVLGGLSLDHVLWAFRPNPSTLWHPLVWLSLMADATLLGPGPAGFHATNVALHAANAVLVFLLLNAATRSPWPSALAAALFAVHPVHVESVAWISERKDVLSQFLLLLTLCAYGRYVRRRSLGRYALTALGLALALMAKPNTAVLPALLLALDIWPLGRFDPIAWRGLRPAWTALRPLLLEKLPLVLPVVPVYWMNTAFGSLPSQVLHSEAIPLLLRVENALVALWAYPLALVRPSGLAVFYPFPDHIPPTLAGTALLGLLLALSALARFGRRRAWLIAGAAWYLLSLLPVLGLFQHGFLPARADRYAYLPFLGLYALAAFGAWELCPGRRSRLAWFATALAGVALLVPPTTRQIALWGDSEALFRHAEAVVPGNWAAAAFLGNELRSKGRHAEAVQAYRRALEAKPGNGAALNGLALALDDMGETDQALEAMRQAVRSNPGHPMGHFNLGAFLLQHGRPEEAAPSLRRALELAPDLAYTHQGMGQLHLQLGELDEAAREFRIALEIEPWRPGSHLGLGQVFLRFRDYPDAESEFAKALPDSPDNPEALAGLGFALAHQGRYAEALPHFQTLSRLRPAAAASWYNLGVIQARAGKQEQARQSLERALALEPGFTRARDALEKLKAEPRKPAAASP